MTANVSRAVSFYFRFKHRLYTKTTQRNDLILDCSLLDEDYLKYKNVFLIKRNVLQIKHNYIVQKHISIIRIS